jgi:hypothetical protein
MTVKMLTVYTYGRNAVFLHISAAGPMTAQQEDRWYQKDWSCASVGSAQVPAVILICLSIFSASSSSTDKRIGLARRTTDQNPPVAVTPQRLLDEPVDAILVPPLEGETNSFGFRRFVLFRVKPIEFFEG